MITLLSNKLGKFVLEAMNKCNTEYFLLTNNRSEIKNNSYYTTVFKTNGNMFETINNVLSIVKELKSNVKAINIIDVTYCEICLESGENLDLIVYDSGVVESK